MPYKDITLGEILSRDQLNELVTMCERGTPSITELKSFTHKHADHLLSREVDPDYLAYVLEFTITGKHA